MLQPGDRIGPLRIERALGAGGMGEVWLARDERLERLVAVKLLPAESSLDPAARGRMLREARAASALKHPGIVTVHDIGDHEQRAYIVMEYVEGETFDALVKRRGPLPAAEAVDLVAQVADAVAVAHAAGILHRDLKAQNLMREESGRVKVLDFGLSKRTGEGSSDSLTITAERPRAEDAEAATAATVAPDAATVAPDGATTPAPAAISRSGRSDEPLTAHGVRMGTPGWASPELMDGGLSDVRSDVFALGAVLYHLLTGAMPFPAATWGALRDQIERGPERPSARSPGVPRALDDVVLSALAADPARRPASARAFIVAARAALAPPRTRSRLLVGGAAVVAVAVAALAIVVTRDGGSTRAGGGRFAAVDGGPVDAATAISIAPRKLTALGGCAYLPAFLDEDTLSFDLTREGTVDLYTLDLGGEPVRRTDAPGWEWRSTRGATDREIIYTEKTIDDAAFASRFDLDRGAATRLFPAPGPVVQVADAFFYAPGTAATLRRRQGARDEVFLTIPQGQGVDSIVASHDGTQLALVTFGDSQMARVCVTPTAAPALRCFDTPVGSARPGWAPDGVHVYVHARPGLHRIDTTTGVFEAVDATVQPFSGIAVSPAGSHLVYSECNTTSKLVETAAPKAAIVPDALTRHPQFGPGGLLGFVAGGLPQARVMVRDAAGATREVVRHPAARITGPAFSADGRLVAYAVGRISDAGIHVAAVDGVGTPNRLTEHESDREPLFVDGGIVFTRDDEGGAPRLMRVSLDGSTIERASARPRRTLAIDRRRGRVLLASPAYDYLYWWDPASGKETPGPVLPAPIGDVSISPDGRWLAMSQGENGERILRLDLDGPARPELVYTSPGDVTGGEVAIDDTGRVVIEVTTWEGELWQLDPPAGTRW